MDLGVIGRAAVAIMCACAPTPARLGDERARDRGARRITRLAALPVLSVIFAACTAEPFSALPLDSGSDVDPSQASDPTTGEADETTHDPIATSTDASAGDDDTTTTTDASTTGAPTTATQAGICGDGVVDDDELCDDGNLNDRDACIACVPAACGDGLVFVGEEDCDDGNAVDDDACSNTCVAAACGDGVVQQGEACDDGNQTPDDACTTTCTLPVCGDGIRQTSEFCDDGGASATCDTDCTPAKCGDGLANPAAGEACDDGKVTTLCDADCSLAECGDGALNELAGEACDDGNLSDADSCSSTCDKLKRVVFVSSTTHTGNLGGLSGADAKCQALATSAGLPGKFFAWLSAGVTNPGSRFLRSSVPYVLTTGTTVAKNWKDLTDGVLVHAIDTTEKGTAAPIPNDGCGGGTKPTVWTNTHESATTWNNDGCTGWTATTGPGRLGHAKATNFTWTRYCEGQANSCSWHAAIYCVEQ